MLPLLLILDILLYLLDIMLPLMPVLPMLDVIVIFPVRLSALDIMVKQVYKSSTGVS